MKSRFLVDVFRVKSPRMARAILALASALVGCSGGGGGSPTTPPPAPPPPPPPPPVLTSIAVSGGTTVGTGATLQLTAAPKDQNGNAIAATITWGSSATGVATVSGSGLVTGVTPGTAVITASSGGVQGTVAMVVTPPPPVLTTITISGGTTVVARSDLQLTGLPKDQNGNAIAATLLWSSSAPGVATVNGNGLVTGVAVGTSVITAASGAVSANTTITVTPQILTAITISGAGTVAVGQSTQLSAASIDQNGVGMVAVYTWASDATNIATVSSTGLVTGVLNGTAHITASSAGVNSPQKVITVAAVPLTADVNATISAVFDPGTIDVAAGGSVNWHFFALNHTVTFDAPNAGTPAGIAVTSNATVSRTFTTPGSYAYHCEIHGGMTGTVIVH